MSALERAGADFGTGDERRCVLIDASAMHGYDADARSYFVQWHKDHRARLACVGIVTDNKLWHMVISAMALASSTPMKAFANLHDAQAWASS